MAQLTGESLSRGLQGTQRGIESLFNYRLEAFLRAMNIRAKIEYMAPSIRNRAFLAVILPALLAVGGCRTSAPAPLAKNEPVSYVAADGSNPSQARDTLNDPYPHMLFADGQITLNDRCPVRKSPLNLRLPGLYVNGRPIGFC